MADLRAVCVFCGSSDPADPRYRDAARALGALVARRGLGLVYGGGSVGLMGELADAALVHGGRVTGVIPRSPWAREINHTGLTELHEVGSMHERKRLMYDLSDAFIALLDQMAGAALLTPASRALIRRTRSAEEALAVLAAAGPSRPEERITTEER